MLRTPAREYVLRRGPLGPVAPKAHDMAREYKVLKAVHPFFPPAPEVFLVCEDPSILGAVFFIMERRHGIVVRDRVPPELAAFPDYQQRVSRGFIDCLVQLHAIDIQKHGLISLGKPDGFFERQVRGWFDRWLRAKTEEIALMDRIIQWLTDRMPASPAPTLVHNDFKLDNVMLNLEDPGRIEAVLDWEMATVGDPLVDLGLILCYWAQPSDPGGTKASITAQPGWYTRDELIGRYAREDRARHVAHQLLRSFRAFQTSRRAAADLRPFPPRPDARRTLPPLRQTRLQSDSTSRRTDIIQTAWPIRKRCIRSRTASPPSR